MNQADDLVSPLRYGGNSWVASLDLDLSTSKTIRDFRISYGAARLTSSASQEGSHLQEGDWVDARAAVFRTVVEVLDGRLSFGLGGAVSGRFSLYEHWYTQEDRETWSHLFLLLEPGAAWHVRLPGGGALWQEWTFPLAGMVLRPPYQGLTEVPEPAWEGFGGVRGVQQSIHYRRSFGGRWWGGVSYSFEGLRYSRPRPLSWARHALTLHLILFPLDP